MLKSITRRYIVDHVAFTIAINELNDIKDRIEIFNLLREKLKCIRDTKSLPYAAIYDIAELKIDNCRLIDAARENWLDRLLVKGCEQIEESVCRICSEYEGHVCKPDNVNERNFYAHGGLERNTVEVVLEEPPTLRYYSQCLNQVREYASKVKK